MELGIVDGCHGGGEEAAEAVRDVGFFGMRLWEVVLGVRVSRGQQACEEIEEDEMG